jgi:hypothetical protein
LRGKKEKKREGEKREKEGRQETTPNKQGEQNRESSKN